MVNHKTQIATQLTDWSQVRYLPGPEPAMFPPKNFKLMKCWRFSWAVKAKEKYGFVVNLTPNCSRYMRRN